MINIPEITNEMTIERCAEALREWIGPGKQYTYQEIAASIDVERRTVESWVLGYSVPGLYKFLKLCGVLGPSYANRLLRLVALDGVDRLTPQPVTDPEINAAAARLVSGLSTALCDLRVDHLEKPGLIKIARECHVTLTDWLHEHDKPLHLMEVKK